MVIKILYYILFHTAGKVCSRETTPVSDGHSTRMYLGGTAKAGKAIFTCSGKNTYAKNMTTPSPIFSCTNGVWEDIPGCVPYVQKTSSSCPAGHNTLYLISSRKSVCGKYSSNRI